MKKLNKFFGVAAIIAGAFILAFILAGLHKVSDNDPQNAAMVTELKLKNRIQCGVGFNKQQMALLLARAKEASKK